MPSLSWKTWREKNKERLAVAEVARRRDPKRRRYNKAYFREYYQRRKEQLLAYAAAHYHKNKEARVAYGRDYREHNDTRVRARKAAAYYRDLDETHQRNNACWRAYYAKNKAAVLTRHKAWRDKNSVKVRAQTNARWHRRRALEKLAAKNLGQLKEYVYETRMKPDFVCYYCNDTFPISKLHFDHVVPLSKGGSHSVENICTSCQRCNCSKGSKSLADWARDGQQLLEL